MTSMNSVSFEMPTTGSWEQRGGWVVNALASDFSLTLSQAAGIVGNLGQESIGFTKLQEIQPAVHGSRGGYGWAQWTGSRRVAFEAWATANRLDVSSDEANYGYLCEELRGAYKKTITALRQCTTVDDATWSFGQTFERPGGTTKSNLPGYADRLDYARRALAAATQNKPPVTQSPAAPPIDQDLLTDLVRATQRVVGVTPDGQMGPVTFAAIKQAQSS